MVSRKRKKLGATQSWFVRRRGGQVEKDKKDNGWRTAQQGPSGRGQGGRRTQAKYPKTLKTKDQEKMPADQPRTIATLLVPYSVGSSLMERMQEAEDRLAVVLGGGRVRMVEKGGDVLSNMLTRNDPWASRRVCPDAGCATCKSWTWLQEERKAAKQAGQDLPKVLIQKTSHQCRREGVNYLLQCLHCALEEVRSVYWGESGLSSRQRHGNHLQDVEKGLAANPMVQHCIEVHGGKKPHYLSLVHTIESRPLYRAVRESVQIGQQPRDSRNINRCNEWGTPRVPILSVVGGDEGGRETKLTNPRPAWSDETMAGIRDGKIKRVRYWVEEEKTPGLLDNTGMSTERNENNNSTTCNNTQTNDNTSQEKPLKRNRTGPSPSGVQDLEMRDSVSRRMDEVTNLTTEVDVDRDIWQGHMGQEDPGQVPHHQGQSQEVCREIVREIVERVGITEFSTTTNLEFLGELTGVLWQGPMGQVDPGKVPQPPGNQLGAKVVALEVFTFTGMEGEKPGHKAGGEGAQQHRQPVQGPSLPQKVPKVFTFVSTDMRYRQVQGPTQDGAAGARGPPKGCTGDTGTRGRGSRQQTTGQARGRRTVPEAARGHPTGCTGGTGTSGQDQGRDAAVGQEAARGPPKGWAGGTGTWRRGLGQLSQIDKDRVTSVTVRSPGPRGTSPGVSRPITVGSTRSPKVTRGGTRGGTRGAMMRARAQQRDSLERWLGIGPAAADRRRGKPSAAAEVAWQPGPEGPDVRGRPMTGDKTEEQDLEEFEEGGVTSRDQKRAT